MVLLLALACPESPSAPAPSEIVTKADPSALRAVKIGLNWFPEPEFGGFYDAYVKGTYRSVGLSVDILPGGPGVPVLEMLASGSIDVAISGAEDLLVRRAKGLDAVAVFPGFQDSPVGLLVHAGGPTRYEEVKGPVAIEPGSAFQQFLWAKYAWDGKVALVPTTGSLGPFQADPALAQQAYITSEPCVADSLGLQTAFLPGKDAGWNPYASLAVVRSADKDAPWVAAFREATRKGWEGYLQDPTTGNAAISAVNPEMKLDRLTCIVGRQRPFVTGTDGLGAMTEARWTEIAAALTSAGQSVDPKGAWIP